MAKRRDNDEHRAAESRRIRRRMPGQDARQPTQKPAQPAAPRENLWDLMEDETPSTYGGLPADFDTPPPAQKQKRRREKPPRREKKPRGKHPVLKRLALCLVVLVVVCAASLAVFLRYSTRNDDLWLTLEQVQYRESTILYGQDREGQWIEYATLHSPNQTQYVSYGDIPEALRHAFVSVEDKNFYDHGGVSISRTLYAVISELKYRVTGSYIGGVKQGGSTITQQLVKNLTGDDEATGLTGYLRKVREVWRAWQLERDYSKEEILTAYLNIVPMTGNTVGVQAEAQKLFGKDVSELTLAECASLAAITRNPWRYNPHTNPENHIERRNYVLYLMWEQGYITEAEYEAAAAEELHLLEDAGISYEEPMTSYFTDTVILFAYNELRSQRGLSDSEINYLLYNGGLRIYTTVDPTLQTEMESIMAGRSIFTNATAQAAMVSLNYEGGIAAIVGGLGEKELRLDFNRATMAYRQTGSTMKAIGPYVLALEKDKITWSSAFYDGPVMQLEDEQTGEMGPWPANVTQRYTERDLLVVDAFAQSVNTVAVRVGQTVGWRSIYNFIRKDLGAAQLVRDDIDPGPMVLGSTTTGMTPLEVARGYSIFGNGGQVYTTHSFTHIENGLGTTLLEVNVTADQVIGEDTAYIMNRLMGAVMTGNGTASGQRPGGDMDAVGKTGTTSDNRDHWFVGLTPYYVTAVWYGDDYGEPIYNANRPPITAWRTLMERAQRGLAFRQFPAAGVQEIAYCTSSGYTAGPNCPAATGYYKSGMGPPTGTCPIHG